MTEHRSPVNGQPIPNGRKFEQGEKQREIARKGGQASGRKRKLKRSLREEFEILLAEERTDKSGKRMSVQTGMATAILKQALDGNVRAAEYIRDIIGQKPAENVILQKHDFTDLDNIAAELMKK